MSRQFSVNDTDKWKEGFGNGADGELVISSNTNYSPTQASCSGTGGTKSLSATGAFSAGDIVLIHQSRGTNVGVWELNKVDSYVAGTISLKYDLINTYTDSGNSQAQVILVPQYSSVEVEVGNTWTCNDWAGNVGGLMVVLCNGTFQLDGNIQLNSKGFTGGVGGVNTTYDAYGGTAEGSAGSAIYPCTPVNSPNANGNGGGGGSWDGGGSGNGGGGGGGAGGVVGTDGEDTGATVDNGGNKGAVNGNQQCVIATFGGGGGGGGADRDRSSNGGGGGDGAGMLIVIAKDIDINNSITANGGNGSNSNGSETGSGGGGGGGTIILKGQTVNIGTDKLSTTAGSGATNEANGGNGGKGKVAIYYKNSLGGSLGSSYYGTYYTLQDSGLFTSGFVSGFML